MSQGRWLIKESDEGIIERWVITGKLVLKTPAHFGNGDVSIVTDMPLLRDPLEGKALLTGSAIAGALRSYLREVERGYGQKEDKRARAARLFGSQDEAIGYASLLVVDDALANLPQTELRDGVKIAAKTRTAEKSKLYNFELLPSGTTFNLKLELAIPAGKDGGRFEKEGEYRQYLLESLAIALHGLQKGEIRLGKRKSRGFGQCCIEAWRVRRYNMTRSEDLLAWLNRPVEGPPDDAREGKDIADLLLETVPDKTDQRNTFQMSAVFALTTSLLIRSDADVVGAPDVIHLHSNGQPILSGTSLAGALRARAQRIVNTLCSNPDSAKKFITDLFGGEIEENEKKKLRASRITVNEPPLQNWDKRELVQSRVKIDRFTGGAYPGALFSEQPVWGKPRPENISAFKNLATAPETLVSVELSLREPSEAEIGLLLLLLKDLWTGDLPLGGEASIGRGRLAGKRAEIFYKHQKWILRQEDGRLIIEGDSPADLKTFVEDLVKEMAQ